MGLGGENIRLYEESIRQTLHPDACSYLKSYRNSLPHRFISYSHRKAACLLKMVKIVLQGSYRALNDHTASINNIHICIM